MGNAKQENQRTQYTICIKDYLDSQWEHWFEGMTITHTNDGTTILTGELADQSALYGLLEKIHNLNLSLISFRKEESNGDQHSASS